MADSDSEEVLQAALRDSSDSDEVLQAGPAAKRPRASRHKDKGQPHMIAVLVDATLELPASHRNRILRLVADHGLADIGGVHDKFLLGVAVIHWGITDSREQMQPAVAMMQFRPKGTAKRNRGKTLALVTYHVDAACPCDSPVPVPDDLRGTGMVWLRQQCNR